VNRVIPDRRLLLVHAHPDDETINNGATMARYVADGAAVTLLTCTLGEEGEVLVPELAQLAADQADQLGGYRIGELRAAMAALGVADMRFLGGAGRYRDSGMMGTPANDAPGSFWSAPVDEAAKKLAALLEEERADVLTCYDDIGGYGHPDHIQVHRVGLRAAELAGTRRVYQNTMNRDQLERGRAAFAEQAAEAGLELPDSDDDTGDWGKPESEITAAVDVTPYLEYKRRAMRAHASQISEASFFLAMPDEAFRFGFGTEWFIRDGQGPGITETDLLAGL
jgi:N-acetyl-1-D-myo-inositol-2-amino-2-deoxy-alpha-D-glucopyranoside deacetylase